MVEILHYFTNNNTTAVSMESVNCLDMVILLRQSQRINFITYIKPQSGFRYH